MIFRVCEHYDDNELSNYRCIFPDDCFICYELRTETEPYTISLKTQTIYNKQCGCDGWIHKQCLDKWYKKQKKCPICRLEIRIIVNNQSAIVNVSSYSNSIYYFVCKSLYKTSITILYFFLFYSAIEIYITMSLSRHIRGYNDEYSYLPYSMNK